MFLKRIEILGFKSFAERTIMEFSDGVTALLGPNGCGKSNIVDAIKWVLGEQSVRNMRAERMEDVIFSGTENRKPLNVAEVTLILANESRFFDLDHPEISIRRRIFREGESEYFLNGSSVRLKEIRALFFDTGIGKSAYSVMEQGRIDQVLATSPEERRYLFEEAAGITKFKMRGTEAARKLLRTEENMNQVETILHEVRHNYEVLKKQTETTLVYRRYREQVFQIDCKLKLLQWRELEHSRSRKKAKLETENKKLDEIKKQIKEHETVLADKIDMINTMKSRLVESQKILYGIDIEKENFKNQERNIQSRKKDVEDTLRTVEIREKSAMNSLNKLDQLKITRNSDLVDSQTRLRKIEEHIIEYQKLIDLAELRIKSISNERKNIDEELMQEDKSHENLQDGLHSLTDSIVNELDRYLRDSEDERENKYSLEENLVEKMQELKSYIDSYSSSLYGQKHVPDGKRVLSSSEESSKELEKISSAFEEFRVLFESYRATGKDFMDDFLSPEGIISQKRELDQQISKSKDRRQNFKEQILSLAEEQAKFSEQAQGNRQHLEGLRVEQARLKTQLIAVEEYISSLTRDFVTENNRLKDISQQILEGKAKIQVLNDQSRSLVDRQEELDEKKETLLKDISGLESGITAKNKEITGHQEQLRVLLSEKNNLSFAGEKIQFEIDHSKDEEKKLLGDFHDLYSKSLADFSEQKETINQKAQEIRSELAEIRAKLKGLGQVNLMAPEEFDGVSERYDFLNNQLEDLKKSKADLSQITDEIERESSELFLEAYRNIREKFHEMFRRFFDGGRAEIRLLTPEDPLNSGLEIFVQPPGKKLENISLLSGGEKALCGVALMFATFIVKPSPFFILDEIDAALDEANIQRFVDVLVEFGKTSQFVIITHNRRTVTGAKSLLGVTMQESGISRIITLKLDGEAHEVEKTLSSNK